MKMATAEAGKAAYELGMEICGPYAAVTDDERAQEAGRWVNSFFVSFANTITVDPRKSSATSSPNECSGSRQ